jgi:hypothetical protein
LLFERKVKEAEEAMKNMQQPGLAMFQYLADLSLIFSSQPLYVRNGIIGDQVQQEQQQQQQQQQEPLQKMSFVSDANLAGSGLEREIEREREREGDRDRDRDRGRLDTEMLRALRGRVPHRTLGNPRFPAPPPDRDGLLNYLEKQLYTERVGPVLSESRRYSDNSDPEDSKKYDPNTLETVDPGFGRTVMSNGVLDMRNGVAHSFFVEEVLGDSTAAAAGEDSGSDKGGDESDGADGSDMLIREVEQTRLRVHHREWFASEIDNVVVGVMTCAAVSDSIDANNDTNSSNSDSSSSNTSSSTSNSRSETASGQYNYTQALSSQPSQGDSCLNLALKISRDPGPRTAPSTTIEAQQIDRGSAFGRHIEQNQNQDQEDLGSAGGVKRDSFAFQITLKSGNGVTLPHTVACGVLRCVTQGGSASTQKFSNSSMESGQGSRGGSLGVRSGSDPKRGLKGSQGGSQGSGAGMGPGPGYDGAPVMTCNGASAAEIFISMAEAGEKRPYRTTMGHCR